MSKKKSEHYWKYLNKFHTAKKDKGERSANPQLSKVHKVSKTWFSAGQLYMQCKDKESNSNQLVTNLTKDGQMPELQDLFMDKSWKF